MTTPKKIKFKAGIDYSMSCPAITIGSSSEEDFSECKSFFLTTNKKLVGSYGKNIYGMLNPGHNSQEERFDIISEWAMSIIKKFEVDEVCLENYSFASKGMVFNIGENGGVLKHKIWKEDVKMYIPSPSQVKKFYTGKGNAKKDLMVSSFFEKTSVNLVELIGKKVDASPISDIADSHAMLKFGFEYHFNKN